MAIYDWEMPREQMDQLIRKGAICAECARQLSVGIQWRPELRRVAYLLRCGYSLQHQGIEVPFAPNPMDVPGYNLCENKTRRNEMENRMSTAVGPARARELASFSQSTLGMTKAKEIVMSLWPEAPAIEVEKASILCTQYGLNPLMGHLALVKYDKYEGTGDKRHKVGEDWVRIIPIKANRLIVSQIKGLKRWSYMDNTPRVMTEAEEKMIYGEAKKDRVRAITKLKAFFVDCEPSEVQGYGEIMLNASLKGAEKGNSYQNMAFIRSERNAFDRLAPGSLPDDIVVVDDYSMREMTPQPRQPQITTVDSELWPEEDTVENTGRNTIIEATPPAREDTVIKTRKLDSIQDLFTACYQDFQLQPKQVMDMLKVDRPTALVEPPGTLYMEIAKEISKTKK